MRRPITGARDERRRALMRNAALAPGAAMTVYRKADIAMALAARVVTRDEVMATHRITSAELDDWTIAGRTLGTLGRQPGR